MRAYDQLHDALADPRLGGMLHSPDFSGKHMPSPGFNILPATLLETYRAAVAAAPLHTLAELVESELLRGQQRTGRSA